MYPKNERRTSLWGHSHCDTCKRYDCRDWKHGNRFFDGVKNKCSRWLEEEERDFTQEHYEEMKRRTQQR